MPLTDAFFYYPNRTEYERPSDYGLQYEDASISTPDGRRLHGWFRAARGGGDGAGSSSQTCLLQFARGSP